jgi:hypothetical protein
MLTSVDRAGGRVSISAYDSRMSLSDNSSYENVSDFEWLPIYSGGTRWRGG